MYIYTGNFIHLSLACYVMWTNLCSWYLRIHVFLLIAMITSTNIIIIYVINIRHTSRCIISLVISDSFHAYQSLLTERTNLRGCDHSYG